MFKHLRKQQLNTIFLKLRSFIKVAFWWIDSVGVNLSFTVFPAN